MKMPSEAERRAYIAAALARESEHELRQLRLEISTLLQPGWELTEQMSPTPLSHGVPGAGWEACAGDYSSLATTRGDALSGLLNALRRVWLEHTLAGSRHWKLVEPYGVLDALLADGPDGRRYLLRIEEHGEGIANQRETLRYAQGDFDYAEVGWIVPAALIGYEQALLAALLALPDGAELDALPLINVDFNSLDDDGAIVIGPAGKMSFMPRPGMVVSLTDGEVRVCARLRESDSFGGLLADPLGKPREVGE